jgi:hypothetical protein
MNRIARTALVVTAAVLIASAAACSTKTATSPGAAAASSRAASALANPTVSSDLSATEQQLLANLQANFHPVHPVMSVQAAIKATFPQGDTAKIEAYAVKTFTLAVLHTKGPGSARDTWLQNVVTYAQSQGASAPASPSATAS